MARYNYAFSDYNKEKMARAVGISLPISTKQSVEICRHIKGLPLKKAKVILAEVMQLKHPVPMKRFKKNIGHKKTCGPGRYPQKACSEILKLIRGAESNAQSAGLNTSLMLIRHICAQKASKSWHSGRIRGIKNKSTHIELVLEEAMNKKKDEGKSKDAAFQNRRHAGKNKVKNKPIHNAANKDAAKDNAAEMAKGAVKDGEKKESAAQ